MIFIIGINIGSVVFEQRETYTSSNYWQRFPQQQQMFKESQYVSKTPKGWIPDEVVFAYSAGELIKGNSPIFYIPDAPPLGKYLIGVSILVFNNEHIISIIFGVLALCMVYIISRTILDTIEISLVPPFLLSFEPIFKNQFFYTPLLDTIQLVFLLLSFYFFNKGVIQKKKYIRYFLFASIFLGCFISTKFFVSGITIAMAFMCILFLHKQYEKLFMVILSFSVSIGVLLATYLRVLAFGHFTFFSYIGIQKWIFLYHKSQLILPFSIWPLIIFNRWYVWWGNKPILSDPQWLITWPLITIISFLTISLYIFGKIKKKIEIEVLMVWVVCYFLLFSFGQISSRYFVILIPILYIISIYGFMEGIKKIKGKYNQYV